MASGRFDVTRNRRMGDSDFFNKENGDLRGRGEVGTLGHRGSDGKISKVIENGTRKRKFSPIKWDEVEGAELRISTKKLSGRHSDILPKSFSKVSDSGMNADVVRVYPVDDQIEVSQVSTVENVFGSNGSSGSIISESRADLMTREGHGNRGEAFKRLEDNEFFGDYHITKSRWASGDDDAMADMCCSDDEGMPKRREMPSSPESGKFRMEEHSSNRAGSMGSNEGSCVLEASHGDECPDFMEIEDRHGESKGVFQLNIEDPASPVQGRMNILQSCRSVFEYERLNKISEGAYGVVFRARDKNTGEIVALKKVKMGREAAREGFPLTALREINILMSFNHPSIVSLKEVAMDEGDGIFMVMEYMEHELKGLVDKMKQPFSTSEVKCLMLQILEGVQFLHDNWVIHRDLKTSNILFNNRGVLKICDFGMARQYGSLKPYTSLVVTLWYRAPELLLGEKQYSTAVDMWSVGCIMAELLLGKPLFKGESEIDQLGKIFKTLGSPNERTWPGFLELPGSKASFVSQPYNMLRKVLPAASFTGSPILSDSGFDLLNRLLTFDPNKRITAEAALNHNWFREVPLPKSKDFMPTFPVQCVQGWSHEQISRKY